jgi:hypothetical protein
LAQRSHPAIGEREAVMKVRHTMLTLALGTTLALSTTAQANVLKGDRSLPTTHAVAKRAAAAQTELRLRAQYLARLADFWRVHSPGGVAPIVVTAPVGGDSGCALGDWCG